MQAWNSIKCRIWIETENKSHVEKNFRDREVNTYDFI